MGNKVTLEEKLRQSKRAIYKSCRELGRESRQIQAQEKMMISEIQKLVKVGNINTCKILARDIVRSRGTVNKLYQMRSNLQGINMRMTILKSTKAINRVMLEASKTSPAVDNHIKLPMLQKVIQEFNLNSERMDMKQEMINYAVDMALEQETNSEELERS